MIPVRFVRFFTDGAVDASKQVECYCEDFPDITGSGEDEEEAEIDLLELLLTPVRITLH